MPVETESFTVPDADTQARRTYDTDYRRYRARHIRDLIALAPPDKQDEAMTAVLEIERLHAEAWTYTASSWLETVERAYQAGRADGRVEGVKVASDAMGLSDPPPTAKPETWH